MDQAATGRFPADMAAWGTCWPRTAISDDQAMPRRGGRASRALRGWGGPGSKQTSSPSQMCLRRLQLLGCQRMPEQRPVYRAGDEPPVDGRGLAGGGVVQDQVHVEMG